MTSGAALFDIDGTLVDSNYLHVDAWSRAFEDVGQPVEAWRIHRSIGMDGEKLLDALLPDADSAVRNRASQRHSKHYLPMASRLRPFPGGRELLRELTKRGLVVVLATSAPEAELKSLRSTLQVEDAIDIVTSAEDVDTAKPAPDIVQVALERAATAPADAVMIGDTVWDVKAAERAGVACIGLLSGGISANELRTAGAAAVYFDVSELLDNLERSPLGARRVAENDE
jgi:HAD superfamily hydrolase (TIGR01509 family)